MITGWGGIYGKKDLGKEKTKKKARFFIQGFFMSVSGFDRNTAS